MGLYKPSELHKLGVRAKKRYSQNFLIDQNILEKICKSADVKEGDHILEIGPGPGALTEKLLEKGAIVHAIEKDPELAEKLQGLKSDRLQITEGDALTCPLNLKHPTKVVANLPYNITTPLIERFVHLHPPVTSLTVMVQKEVGERMTAKINTPQYSSFTLFLSAYSSPKYCFTVKPNSFYPAPSVHSCVIHMPLHPFPYSFSEEGFFLMTRTAFNQRRKMLRSTLKKIYDPEILEMGLAAVNIAPTVRPQELSLEDFAKLYAACEKSKPQ
ncbi:MAG: 16S rRNA (adenine(1518)-N(6)/adenine(1519)-N(6))-dimethyltransferase RsmA [Simkaniaceae bacterium]|nr:16S rRNA (adenine(1518)-N(6)/adenine(1519)-N(6))-dimethyltransferase RsmA [Candidatus Sacchlamyda saccharinae]